MKKHFTVAGFFASFALICVYFTLYLIGDGRAWWISLAVGAALFLILVPVFFLAGLKRAAWYDEYEKTLSEPYKERFILSFREKGGLHTDARLYILENGFLFVDRKGKKKYERIIRPEETTNFDLSGEDIEIYLKSGELILLEAGEKEKLTPYFEKLTGEEEK